MAKRYFSTEKSTSFQGHSELWTNVYLYETGADTASAYNNIIDAIVNAEKTVHGNNVNFLTARVFTTKGLNGVEDTGHMLHIRNLSGTGDNSSTNVIYKECAVLVKWPLPRKSNLAGLLVGRQRSLKKWLHVCTAYHTGPGSAAAGETPINKTAFLTYGNAVMTPVAGTQLIAPDGTVATANPQVQDFMEHRQFPRGRKEKHGIL
jgi:hypothetical protein